ncbi:MAG: hypothetical protein RLZZ592_1974, partial [Pseudomonadota bacterium]
TLQPGAGLVSDAHEPGTQEHVSVLAGRLTLQAGEAQAMLTEGETARYAADTPHALRNAGKLPVRALLVVMHSD